MATKKAAAKATPKVKTATGKTAPRTAMRTTKTATAKTAAKSATAKTATAKTATAKTTTKAATKPAEQAAPKTAANPAKTATKRAEKAAPKTAANPAKPSRATSAATEALAPEHDELLAAYWQQPDPATLRVWADSLIERGDVRGEYIQMCLVENPTDAHKAAREAFDKKHHGKLAGPARPFLRELELGANGLVERARCEADLLVQGLPHIEWLNPELALSVTSVDGKGKGLEDCSLERIYHVNFAFAVIGSQGGCNMKDATLIRIAPALRRVRHLTLQCTGYADKCFSPAALQVLGETVENLEYLAFNYYNSATGSYADPKRRGLAPLSEYAKVIATAPGFKKLKVLFIRGLTDRSIVSSLNLAHLETLEDGEDGAWSNTSAYGADYGLPGTADEIEPLKRAG